MTHLRSRLLLSIAALGVLSACGGSSTSPGGGGTAVVVRDGGTGGANGATVVMTAQGLSATTANVAVRPTVTVVNNDTKTHEIASNPHPQHRSAPRNEAGPRAI